MILLDAFRRRAIHLRRPSYRTHLDFPSNSMWPCGLTCSRRSRMAARFASAALKTILPPLPSQCCTGQPESRSEHSRHRLSHGVRRGSDHCQTPKRPQLVLLTLSALTLRPTLPLFEISHRSPRQTRVPGSRTQDTRSIVNRAERPPRPPTPTPRRYPRPAIAGPSPQSPTFVHTT